MSSARNQLLAALDQLGTTAWSGIAYRFASPKRSALSGQGAYIYGGRWNPRESFPCIYLAEPRQACIQEFYRRAKGQAHGAASLLPQILHTIRVSDLEVLDLTGEGTLEQVSLAMDDIEDDDQTACAEVGAAAHFLGFQGVRAPSATSTGSVIAVFERKYERGQLTVLSSDELELNNLTDQ